MSKPADRLRPVHPGEVLREDFLAPLGLSVNALALALGVPSTRIHEIVKERRTVTADTALRLAQYFGGDAASWLSLQANYDLKTLPTRAEIAKRVPHRSLAVA
jgi:addiction module HigA family antidote